MTNGPGSSRGELGCLHMGIGSKILVVGGVTALAGISMVWAIGTSADGNTAPSPDEREVTEVAKVDDHREVNILEQAILDAFPADGSNGSDQAKDFIAMTINSEGHLCAQPIEMAEAAPKQYGIGCVTNRNGSGKSNYLIDTRTGSVTKI